MAMTTNSSMRVKAARARLRLVRLAGDARLRPVAMAFPIAHLLAWAVAVVNDSIALNGLQVTV